MSAAAPQPSAAAIPAADAVMGRASGENFPVASFVLPARSRRHLLAIYGFARLVDELGDSLQGDRLAALDWLEGELGAAFAGGARHPLMRTLSETIAECGLQRGPFQRLIEANRIDQLVSRYETWEQLERYCDLSANPVGELVLAVLGLATPERIALSDRICTALQLVEHCQDVSEDLAAGRIYMPAQDMARCGCGEDDLEAPHAGPEVKSLIALQARRAASLLSEGAPLIDTLRGRPRIAVAAFHAGGLAALHAIKAVDYDVLAGPPKAGGARLARTLLGTLSRRALRVRSRSLRGPGVVAGRGGL